MSERKAEAGGSEFWVLGVSHRNSSVACRERVALQGNEGEELGRALVREGGQDEIVILSTCNRFEIYGHGAVPASRRALDPLLASSLGRDLGSWSDEAYLVSGEAAIAHLFRVTASLDSLVLGEAQILGQVKKAYERGRSSGTVGRVLGRLFTHGLRVGKRVRDETAIGTNPVSVASAAVDLAEKIFGSFEGIALLVAGVGEMSELALRHFRDRGLRSIVVANRTLARAEELASRFDGEAVCLDELGRRLEVADVLLCCTGAPGLILDRKTVEAACRRGRSRPLFIIDIAVPRDVDPSAHELEDVFLYDIDDLQRVVDHNRRRRRSEAAKAEALVAEELASFELWMRSIDGGGAVAGRLTRRASQVARDEYERLESRLRSLPEKHRKDVAMALDRVGKKLLHEALRRLRHPAEGDEALPELLDALFGLEEEQEQEQKQED